MARILLPGKSNILIGKKMLRNFDFNDRTVVQTSHQNLIENSFANDPKDENYVYRFGNKVHKSAFVEWSHVKIGTGNVIGPFACIGTEAQHIAAVSEGKIEIGNNNTIREFSTIHRPTDEENGTVLGNNNYIMAGAHINHDCILEDDIVLCNNAALAGHVHVMKGAFLSMNCSIHQNQVIGSWSIIGMNSCVTKSAKVEPGYKFFGVPAKRNGRNSVALKRHEVTPEQLSAALRRFSVLRDRGHRN